MIYEDQYLVKNCIIAENRQHRPSIGETVHSCPFCVGHEKDIEKVWIEVKEEKEFLVKIINNKYPICGYDQEPYGIHDVVIDTPRHLEAPKDFSKEHWMILLETMQKRWFQIVEDPKIKFIQIFKNYGKEAGASIRHSHWQIVALDQIPYPMLYQYTQYNTFEEPTKGCYICHTLQTLEEDYLIEENDRWVAIAPRTSEFAHETWLLPKIHRKGYGDLCLEEIQWAGIMLKRLLEAYEGIKPGLAFNICFMSGGIRNTLDYHFYIKIIPRLANWAGFELATHCYINTIHPKAHVQLMRGLLRE